MSACCNADTTGNSCGCSVRDEATAPCPTCSHTGRKVSALTMRSQLTKALLERYGKMLEGFNFCTNPACQTVYYDDGQSLLVSEDGVKSKVTIKNNDPKTPLCYCKKLLKKDVYEMIRNKEQDIAGKIRDIIASGKSFCEKSNPKGVCCTEDVDAFLKAHGIPWTNTEKSAAAQCC